jgi:hypothetical protein
MKPFYYCNTYLIWRSFDQDIFLVLMVGNQIANLTPNNSFDHNLICKSPNGGCKNIPDIYIWRFLWNFEKGSIWILFPICTFVWIF